MPRKPSRKLKTYQTSLGFYDQAVAAPSMKAALEAWGAKSNLFHQGIAKETDDPDIVAATMAAPGVVLRRPVGSDGPFTEHADLPTDLADDEDKPKSRSRPKSNSKPKEASGQDRGEVLSQKRRSRRAQGRRGLREGRAAARKRAPQGRGGPRQRARASGGGGAAAQAALDKARREHQARADAIEADRAALDERAEAEETRWGKQRIKLEEAVRRARE